MSAATVIAALVLLLCVWPLFRLVSIPSMRREYSRVVVIAVLTMIGWAAVVAILAFLLPAVLLPAAAVAGVLLVLERWRARVGYGAKRGLPPGSLGLVPRGPWVDEGCYAKLASAHGPVFKMSQFFRPMVCLMGPAEGVDLLERHADDLYSPPVRFNRFIPKGYIRYMAPQDHAVYKPIIRNALNGKVLADCSDSFARIIVDGCERMQLASASNVGVHPEAELGRVTFRCMLRLIPGLEHESADIDELLSHYRNIEIGKAASRWRAEDREAANAIADYIAHRMESADELPPCVLGEIARPPGSKYADRTLALNLVYMIRISASDLAGFLTWAVKLLADNPAWLRRLQEIVRGGSEEEAAELADLMLREMLRLERSEFIFRKARRTFKYKGFTIPSGWLVRVCIRDGHRNPQVFHNPAQFDPLRFKGRSYSKREYSPLGIGPHACAGGKTIQTVGRIFLIELARGWSLSVIADGPREYGRAHWQPNSDFRIALHPTGSSVQT